MEFPMATVQISLEEYLRTSYHPDCDFVDGEVQERNLGEFDHGAVQGFLTSWFFQHRHEWQLHVIPELRIRVSAARVRIADVCLMARSQPIEQVPTRPPLAVIEILSPEDRIARYNERLSDYRNMGIQNVWVIDPINAVGYDCSTAAWLPVEEFHIAGSPIFLRLNDLWSELEASR
jgi:Uma2 family endonuclease